MSLFDVSVVECKYTPTYQIFRKNVYNKIKYKYCRSTTSISSLMIIGEKLNQRTETYRNGCKSETQYIS